MKRSSDTKEFEPRRTPFKAEIAQARKTGTKHPAFDRAKGEDGQDGLDRVCAAAWEEKVGDVSEKEGNDHKAEGVDDRDEVHLHAHATRAVGNQLHAEHLRFDQRLDLGGDRRKDRGRQSFGTAFVDGVENLPFKRHERDVFLDLWIEGTSSIVVCPFDESFLFQLDQLRHDVS